MPRAVPSAATSAAGTKLLRCCLQRASSLPNNGLILTQKRLVYLELSTVSDFILTYVPVAMYNYARCLVQTVQVSDTPEKRKIFQLGKISFSTVKM